jgi:hypothetical protein
MAINYRNKVNLLAGVGIDELFTADVDLSACQYHLVQPASTAGNVTGATGASNPTPMGVLQNAPALGQAARVRMFGVTQLVVVTPSGCGLAYGRFISASTVGQGVPSACETGGPIVGRWIDTGVAVSTCTVGKAFVNCGGFSVCPVAAS